MFQEDEKKEKPGLKSRERANPDNVPKVKSVIPGLDFSSKVISPIDENLAPLNSKPSETFQYGQTNFKSITTDQPQWSPGVCLYLDKYEGIFKVKSNRIHQKVK